MEPFLLVAGLTLLVATAVDLLWTTLWISGHAGPITGRVSSATWRLLRAVADDRHQVRSLFGPGSLVGAVALWAALLWAGWTLVFSADPGSVRDATTGESGDLGARLYFTGYAIFTMGNGELVPSAPWRIPTVLMNASGLILLTLTVSYLVSVVSAVVSGRTFAARVHALGETVETIILVGWHGSDLRVLQDRLTSFEPTLSQLASRHAAYPVLRFYQPGDEASAAPRAVACLEDATSLLASVPSEPSASQRFEVALLRQAIDRYVNATSSVLPTMPYEPPMPDQEVLAAEGVRIDRDEVEVQFTKRRETRRALAGLLRDGGWTWPAATRR